MRKRLFKSLLFLICLSVLSFSFIHSSEKGTFWCRVFDSGQNPVKGIKIIISNHEKSRFYEFVTDKNGFFSALGFESGLYFINLENSKYKSFGEKKVYLDSRECLLLKITLLNQNEEGNSNCRPVHIDYSSAVQSTLINRQQIKEMPSGHNLWSLIENQDLSAVTDRIDVGGLWSGIPALYSARGASSWTQNRFLLNGMDITDPYQGGMPLLFPDIFSLHHYNSINAGHLPENVYPGGYLNLITGSETEEFHGSVSGFYTQHSLQSSNITESLENEGISENHTFDYFTEGNVSFSGPVIPKKLSFSTSATGFDLSRDLAEFDGENKTSLVSGLLSLKYSLSAHNTFRLLYTGHSLNHSSLGAGRDVPFSATHKAAQNFHILQAFWNSRFHHQHELTAGMGYVYGNERLSFQENAVSPHSQDIVYDQFLGGAAPFSEDKKRQKFIFLLKGKSNFPQFLGLNHTLQYGLNLQLFSSSQDIDVIDSRHLYFFKTEPIQTALYNTPVLHEEAGTSWSFYIQDTLTFSNLFSIYLGAHLSSLNGWVPGSEKEQNKINWQNISPRIGLIIPLSKAKTSVLKLSYARYFNTLPLKYLSYGNPNALGSLIYSWNDTNQDQMFQSNEQGELLRREGPFYSSVDPNIKRPYTDEVVIAYDLNFKPQWHFSLSGFYRVYKSFINTFNSGVTFSEYESDYLVDIGDDRIPYTYDDLIFTVFNQKQESLGRDSFWLSNTEADTRATYYYGLDLNLIKHFGDIFSLFFSFTAINAVGTTNPGNSCLENDIGVIGSLFDNPNAMINTEGRPCFDRGYTARLGFKYSAPLGFLFSGIAKYYDGQPFSRKIIIEGFNQGPFTIQAHPSGVSRYEFNSTVDLRLEKRFHIGNSLLRFILDGFNVLNLGLATEENEWTGPEYPLRYATEIQSPRVFRLGISYEF